MSRPCYGPADLGLDVGLGARRCRRKHQKRSASAAKVVPRIKRAVGQHNVGRKLMHASVHSRLRYGPTVLGCTAVEWKQLRRTQGLSLDGGRRNRCLTTLIGIMMGPDKDAVVVQLQSLVRMWFKVWQESSQLHSKIHKAWSNIVQGIQDMPPAQRWRRVVGPNLGAGLCSPAPGVAPPWSHGMELTAGQPLDH